MMANTTRVEHEDLFNETLIQSYISRDQNPRFLARPWLTERVKAALKEDNCRFVLLTAEPGAGKTAFMAWLADQHPGWPRYFIRRDQRTPLQDADDHSFLLRIGYQLAATRPELFSREQVQLVVEQRLGDVADGGEAVGAKISRLLASPFYQKVIDIRQYVERTGGAVTGLKIDELVIEPSLLSPEDLQNMALFDPARALQTTDPEARIVILVDALDEIRYHGVAGSLLEWLTHCPEVPDNVRFVLTSRRPDGPTKLFCEKQKPFMQQLTINPGDEPVQRELEVYARALAQEPDVASILEGIETGADEFVEEAVAKADGNIGYLDALARGVDQARTSKDREGLRKLLTLQELPRYIEGLYAFFIRQIKESIGEQEVRVRDSDTGKSHFPRIWDEVYWPVLGVLCVAREPLLVGQVRRLGAIEAEERYVIQALDRLGQFLDRPDGRCRLYHATLPEFLTAVTTRQDPETQDLAIQPATWHRKIADYYWQAYHADWQGCDAYGLRFFCHHLFAAGDWTTLHTTLGSGFIEYKFQTSIQNTLPDIELGIRAAELGGPNLLPSLFRYTLLPSGLRTLAASLPTEFLASLVWLGHSDKARDLLSLIPNPWQRAEKAARISEVIAEIRPQASDKEHLIAEIRFLCTAASREGVLNISTNKQLAQLVVRLGSIDPQEAIQLMSELIDDPYFQSQVFEGLAKMTALEESEGLLEKALFAASAISGPGYRFERLVAIADTSVEMLSSIAMRALRAAWVLATRDAEANMTSVTDRMSLARVAKRLDPSAAYELVQETWQLISEKDDEVAEAECCRIFFVDAQEIFPDLALRALNRLEWIRNKLSHEPKLSREADPADPVWEIHQRHHTHKLSRATTELAIAMAHHDPERAIALVRMIPNAAGRYLAVRELAPCIAASDLPRAIELRLQVSGFGDLPRDLAALVATNLAQPLNLPTQVRISQAAKLIGEHLAGTSEATALAFLLEHVAKQTPSLASAMLPQILTGIPWFRMAHSKDTRLAKLADLWGGTVRVADRYGQHSVASERTTLSSDSHEFCVLDAAIAKAHLDDHLETALEDLWMLSAEYYIPKPLAQKMLESIATKVGQLRGNARERLIGELALRAWDICESRAWLIGFLRHLMQMLQVVNRLDERDHIEAEIYVTRALSSALSDDTARWWAFVCEVLKEQAAHGSKHLMAATMAQWAVFESVIDGRVLDELQAAYDQIEAFFGRLPYVLFADLRPKEEDADDR